jgi:hypothetical protein
MTPEIYGIYTYETVNGGHVSTTVCHVYTTLTGKAMDEPTATAEAARLEAATPGLFTMVLPVEDLAA